MIYTWMIYLSKMLWKNIISDDFPPKKKHQLINSWFPSSFHCFHQHVPRFFHLEHCLDLFLHRLSGQEPGHHVALGDLAADLQEPVDLTALRSSEKTTGEIHGENDEIFWKYMGKYENLGNPWEIWVNHGKSIKYLGKIDVWTYFLVNSEMEEFGVILWDISECFPCFGWWFWYVSMF